MYTTSLEFRVQPDIMALLSPPPQLRRLGVRQKLENFYVREKPSENLSAKHDSPKRKATNYQQVRQFHLGRTSAITCKECERKYLSFNGFDAHLDKHPGKSVRCWNCNIRFLSNKSLIAHQRHRHSMNNVGSLKTEPFTNLEDVDFSCSLYPSIAKYYCENNCQILFHTPDDYNCSKCHLTFPVALALEMHNQEKHVSPGRAAHHHCINCHKRVNPIKDFINESPDSICCSKHIEPGKADYIKSLGLISNSHIAYGVEEKWHNERNNYHYNKQRKLVGDIRAYYTSEQLPEHSDSDSVDSS